MGIINRSKLGAVAEVNTTYVRRGGKDEMEAEVTSNARSAHHTCSGQAAQF